MTERGVATTEAVVSLPVIALLLGGMLHLYGLLAASLQVRAAARQEAWALRDAPDCARGGVDLRAQGRAFGLPGDIADKVPGGLDAIFSYGRARGQASRDVALRPLMPGESGRRVLRAGVVVTCNEPDHRGLVEALVGILRHVSGL